MFQVIAPGHPRHQSFVTLTATHMGPGRPLGGLRAGWVPKTDFSRRIARWLIVRIDPVVSHELGRPSTAEVSLLVEPIRVNVPPVFLGHGMRQYAESTLGMFVVRRLFTHPRAAPRQP